MNKSSSKGSIYAAIMPIWRINKGHWMGASCGHKRPQSTQEEISWPLLDFNFNIKCPIVAQIRPCQRSTTKNVGFRHAKKRLSYDLEG